MQTFINSIDRTTTSALLADQLRKDIILNKYPKGFLLNELSLAESMNASRASIRTALIELEREGLLCTLSNGRKMVEEFNDQTINDVYHVRAVLECEAAEQILKKDVIDCTKMMKCIHEFELLLAEKNIDRMVNERAKNDAIFHRAIMEQSGNRYLLQCWLSQEPIYVTLRNLQATIIQPEAQYVEYILKHKKILDLFMNRNPAITTYLNEHISGATAMLITSLKAISEVGHSTDKSSNMDNDNIYRFQIKSAK